MKTDDVKSNWIIEYYIPPMWKLRWAWMGGLTRQEVLDTIKKDQPYWKLIAVKDRNDPSSI